MNEIRRSIARMKDEEKQLLKKREGDLDRSIENTLFMLFLGISPEFCLWDLANFAIFRDGWQTAQSRRRNSRCQT